MLPRIHTCAYTGAATNAADFQLPALTDSVLQIQANDFTMSWDSRIVCMWAGGAALTDSRLNAPSIVTYGDLYVNPVDLAATPASPPGLAYYQPESPLIRRTEAVRNKVNDTTGTTDRVTTVVTLIADGDQIQPLPPGQFCAFRFTSTTTATANAWSQLAIVLTTTPPAGTYACIGIDCVSTNGIAVRTIWQDKQYRPGMLMRTLQSRQQWDLRLRWYLGVFGYFYPPLYPIIEVLCNGADASFTGWIFCVKISDQPSIPV